MRVVAEHWKFKIEGRDAILVSILKFDPLK